MTSDIPDKAVTAGVENLRDWLLTVDIGLDEFERMGPLSATDVVRGVLSAALPVLNTGRPRLVSGDIPITERTPHGVWIADGPDPDRVSPRCGGLTNCGPCRDYDALRQHLVEQIMLLDQQRQDEAAHRAADELNILASAFAEGRDALAALGRTGEAGILGGCAKSARDRAASLRGRE